jgi:hypothetical protein
VLPFFLNPHLTKEFVTPSKIAPIAVSPPVSAEISISVQASRVAGVLSTAFVKKTASDVK